MRFLFLSEQRNKQTEKNEHEFGLYMDGNKMNIKCRMHILINAFSRVCVYVFVCACNAVKNKREN